MAESPTQARTCRQSRLPYTRVASSSTLHEPVPTSFPTPLESRNRPPSCSLVLDIHKPQVQWLIAKASIHLVRINFGLCCPRVDRRCSFIPRILLRKLKTTISNTQSPQWQRSITTTRRHNIKTTKSRSASANSTGMTGVFLAIVTIECCRFKTSACLLRKLKTTDLRILQLSTGSNRKLQLGSVIHWCRIRDSTVQTGPS